MVYATVIKEFSFDAAHRLEGHKGPCNNLHGHTYRLQVGISGSIKNEPGTPDEGMVLDFAELKHIVKTTVLNKVDHQYLNEILPFRTTAENIAVWMLTELRKAGLPVQFVRLYETPTSCVEIYERDVPK